MKRLLSILIASVIFINFTFTGIANASMSINTTSLNQGVVGIQYNLQADKRTRLLIENKNGRYVYDLMNSKAEQFPLQLGNGEYTISVVENTVDNKYRVVSREKVNLQLADEKNIYLNSIQIIKWDRSMKSIVTAQELTKAAKTDLEKVEIIYDFIVNRVKYDYDKVNKLPVNYVPNIESTFYSNAGICYDYAALFAGMLRSVGVPTKLVMGNTTYVNEYHAWNEVYVEGLGWLIIDTTVDAALKASNKNYSMIKDTANYAGDKVF